MNGNNVNSLKVLNFYSSDVSDLASFAPKDNESIYFPLEFEIGPHDGAARALFSVMVATPESLRKHARKPRAENTKYLIIHHYNWEEIQSRIYNILHTTPCSIEDPTPLLRYFNWEYEGYTLK